MSHRPRIDLDGVALTAQGDETEVLAVFRYRTHEGLVLLMPESGDFLVPWSALTAADLDLQAGVVRLIFEDTFASTKGWLRGANVLIGTWTDRVNLSSAAVLGTQDP